MSTSKELVSSSSTALVLANDNNNVKKKVKPKKVALEEDEFTEAMGSIIRRDFFPDLPKLEAQLAFIEATESGDTDKLREISARYPTHIQTPNATPSTFQTPINNTQQQNNKRTLDNSETSTTSNKISKPEDAKSLDVFLNTYHSEDDASFDNIMEIEEEKRLQKYAWMYERETLAKSLNSNVPALTSGDGIPRLERSQEQPLSITDGSERDGRGQIKMWDYTAKNTLMYIPDGAQESSKELISKRKDKIIKHSNTRLSSDFLRKMASVTGGGAGEGFVSEANKEKVGIDGKQLNVTDSPRVGGYGFVATPQINPGVDASPMMTWGTIEGTPLQLTTDIVATPGPVFKIPKTPRREALAHQLAEKASKSQSEKKRVALEKTSLLLKSPSGRMTPGTAERLKLLSPAARKLVSSPAGVGIFRGTDKSLRASYTPKNKFISSPSPRYRQNSSSNTPSTVQAVNSSSAGSSLTDNLLDLRNKPY